MKDERKFKEVIHTIKGAEKDKAGTVSGVGKGE